MAVRMHLLPRKGALPCIVRRLSSTSTPPFSKERRSCWHLRHPLMQVLWLMSHFQQVLPRKAPNRRWTMHGNSGGNVIYVTPSLMFATIKHFIILETAVRDAKLAQDLELESLCSGAGHSRLVKDRPTANDSGSRDCVKLASPTAVFRIIQGGIQVPLYQHSFVLNASGSRCSISSSARFFKLGTHNLAINIPSFFIKILDNFKIIVYFCFFFWSRCFICQMKMIKCV